MATGGAGVLRQLLAVFTFETDTRGLDKGKEKLRDWVGDMKKVAAAFAGGAIAKGIWHFVKDTLDEMMNIRKGAQELKITTDEMQQLQSAARATGMDVKWLHFTLERLEVNVERAGHGAARQAEAMRLLGINAKHANGSVKSAKELFLDFASGMEKVTNQNTQARAVWDLMGRGAHRLLPLLRMGRARVEELMQATEEYGKYQKEEIEQAAKYAITLERLRLVWMSIKGFIMSQWLPVLEKQTEKMIKAGKWMLAMAKNSLIAKAALYTLQAAMVGLGLKMMFAYPYATALMGAIVGLVGALDDLMVWWEGGDSVIGRILDGLFGKGASTATLEKVKDIWRDISQFAALAWQSVKKVLGIKETAEAEYGPETPEAYRLRTRKEMEADAARSKEERDPTTGQTKAEATSWLESQKRIGRFAWKALKAVTPSIGMATDDVTRTVIGDFEPRLPAISNPASAGGGVTVNFNGPVFHPEDEIRRIAAAAFDAADKGKRQAAAANLRREKQASGE